MATRLWLMRHAQTDRPDIFHGFESDTDLSELGYKQAETVAAHVAALRPDVLISSGMKRARKTADPIARACNLPVQVEPLLHERKVGALVGSPAASELGIWPETLEKWIAGDTSYSPPGAESWDDLRNRLLPVVERIVNQHEGKSMFVVAHGIVCRVLLFELANLPLTEWVRMGKMHNISIAELVHEQNRWRAERMPEVPEAVRRLS